MGRFGLRPGLSWCRLAVKGSSLGDSPFSDRRSVRIGERRARLDADATAAECLFSCACPAQGFPVARLYHAGVDKMSALGRRIGGIARPHATDSALVAVKWYSRSAMGQREVRLEEDLHTGGILVHPVCSSPDTASGSRPWEGSENRDPPVPSLVDSVAPPRDRSTRVGVGVA